MSQIKEYINQNSQRFLDELFDLLRIPSVSADSKFENDVIKAAEYVKEKLIGAGIQNAKLYKTEGYPIVYGENIINKDLPTILIYGHYDVQPADPLELWESPPFTPSVKDGKIIARGSSDDKGQMYMHIKAYEVMKKTNHIACNVKFMIEGEEEIGSNNIDKFVKAHHELLQADVVLISDTSMISTDTPSVTVGLRGLSYVEVEVTGPNRDLHSGTYGGTVANPINTLCDLIASLKDHEGKITIPGFYNEVQNLSKEERDTLNLAPFDLLHFKEELDIDQEHGEQGYTTLERIGIRPTLDVNGIWGGYIGEGAKTVIPSKAFAKISMRLVPHQNSKKITSLFENHFKSIAPSSVKVKVTPHHGGESAITPTDSMGFQAASQAFERAWGKIPIPTRDGGSIPIVALLQDELRVDTILLGFGLDEDAIHSPNESYRIEHYLKGIETIVLFHQYFAELHKS